MKGVKGINVLENMYTPKKTSSRACLVCGRTNHSTSLVLGKRKIIVKGLTEKEPLATENKLTINESRGRRRSVLRDQGCTTVLVKAVPLF